MELSEAIRIRHSVRRYTDRPIEDEKKEILLSEIAKIRTQSGLRIELYCEEPEAFCAGKPHYGSFSGCRNYLAMIGKKGDDEKIGYYGEQLVLLATTLGLDSCWVALTYEKNKVPVVLGKDEKIFDLIALGYGETHGVQHKSKTADKVAAINGTTPDWFRAGVEAALLAPTAINQQQFFFRFEDGVVKAKAKFGPCAKTDLGIVKYHFEIGAGKENFRWEESQNNE